MSDWLGTLQLFALAGFGVALVSVPGVALLYALLRARIQRLAPRLRARVLSGVAGAPLALPALLVFLCVVPSLLAMTGLRWDHCEHHAEHFHLCLTHRPPGLPPLWAFVSLLGAVPLVGAVVTGSAGGMRSRRLLRSLQLGSSSRLREDVHRLGLSLPVSVTSGLLRPRIFVSRGLVAALPAGQLEVVIEHERAHARRRDGLRKWVAASLSWSYPRALRRRLLADLSLACEQACDAAAARRVGDRMTVAEAIVGAARLLDDRRELRGVCGFGGSTVPERVERLLDEDPTVGAPGRPGPVRVVVRSMLAAIAALALAGPLHHGVEHFLSLLLP